MRNVVLKELKKMKVCLLIRLILIMMVSVVTAQDPPKPILEPGDVKHFIKTFPLLEKEMKNHGFKYEARGGTMTVPEAIKSRNELFEKLKKHGWDDNFYKKTGVIILGYSSIVYGEEMKKADGAFEESLKEIDSNPHLSDEMKKQLKEQMKAAESAMKMQGSAYKSRIHPNDLKMISPHVKEIQKVIDKEYKSESSRISAPTSRHSRSAADQATSNLATQINALLKRELEKEFGPLSSEILHDRQEMYGRVIGCDYGLQQGNLDESWGNGVVTAMGRLGITAVIDGSEVIAEGQEIANTKFIRLQFTTSRGTGDPDLIGATFLFPID